ncbi:MAG: glycosyltransferase family 39 protein [Desulfobulbaceae bacterium]|jgi:uncharacterized membrane protein|nr:glycosyltransferase family 39 protein [Desulfobulbaceae bacterium]
MMNINMENDDVITAGARKLLLIVSCIGIAGCLLALIPQIRSAIITFGENAILHRMLINRELWNMQLLLTSIAGLLISGALLFSISPKFQMPQFPAEKKTSFYTLIEILLIALFLLLVVILATSNQSVWLDEVYSLTPTRHSWNDLIHIQSADVHPPLYFLILKLCAGVFGENVFTMKMVSVLPAVLTMIFATLFLNKEFSHKTAVLFLLCFIASESVVHYSIEIRMYSWALFFVTMTAVSAWYIITTGKTKWYAAFLLCAEGAAYTHIYAGLTVGIGYLLLLCYVLKWDRENMLKTFILAPLAVLFYLPWLFIIINSFTRASNDFWIQPLNLKTIAGYVVFIFNAGNPIMTLVFFLLFVAVFYLFLIQTKTQKELFAFAGLSCISILALTGIIVSFLIRPLLADRYLFPACALVWLFFAIVCGSIKNKRIIVFVCSVLLVLGFTTFSSSIYREQKENTEFLQFYSYLKQEITPQDLFIFPPKESCHLPGMTAYLFPGHGHVYKGRNFGLAPAFWEMFDRTLIKYKDLADTGEFQGRGAWVIVSEKDYQGKPMDFVIPPESGAEFRGDFGWGFYRFKLYYTESPGAFSNPDI